MAWPQYVQVLHVKFESELKFENGKWGQGLQAFSHLRSLRDQPSCSQDDINIYQSLISKMVLLGTSEEWQQQTSLLLEARPTTVRTRRFLSTCSATRLSNH